MVLPSAPFKFRPCSHSWVALHPQPKGVIQFIGGAPWGTLPTLTYRHFLKSLFNAGYTVVAYPFQSGLDHWSIALDLLDEHYTLRGVMAEAALANGYDPMVYIDETNYTWIGHSLGGKYVILLELLSGLPTGYFYKSDRALEQRQLRQIKQRLDYLSHRLRLLEKQIQTLTGQTVAYGYPSILHQYSLLLAPVMTDLDRLIPNQAHSTVKRLAKSYPTVEHTHQLIEQSPLFHLTGLLQFARDRTAAHTCHQLMQGQPHIRRRFLKGNHLEPVGIQMGQFILDFNPLDKFIQPLNYRDLEFQALALLQRLQKTPTPVCVPTRASETSSSSTANSDVNHADPIAA